MADLLFEIGSEEIPAGYIDPALKFLADEAPKVLAELRLTHGKVTTEGTPRRLVLIVESVLAKQPDIDEVKLGPPVSAARGPDGALTQAGLGFLRKQGLEGADTFEKDGKLAVKLSIKGRAASDVLPAALESLMARVPFKKTMSWGDARATHKQAFARPVQWILALFDGAPLTVKFADVTSGNVTHGHRYHAPAAVKITSVAQYLKTLAGAQVVLARSDRRQMIVDEANKLATKAGGVLRDDPALLEIVKNLVEKPFPVLGEFEERFLEMPPELLVSEMREHQKYFAVQKPDGTLLPKFVVVAGASPPDADAERTLANGNARVLRARFEDGAFYFKTDREKRLEERVDDLEKLVFHRELGTYRAKVTRLEELAAWLAGAVKLEGAVRDRAMRVAHLCKADLTTGVVGEFPELQGIMGRTYATLDGERADIGIAIDGHYAPRTAGAAYPRTHEGAVVGICDRIDNITGILGIGKGPTGSADPFGLRRAAIAILNVAMDRGYAFSLAALVHESIKAYRAQGKLTNVDDKKLEGQVLELVRGRMKGVLVERCQQQGLEGAEDIVDAAMAAKGGIDDLVDVHERTLALAKMRLDDKQNFLALAATFKRVGNILRKARDEKVTVGGDTSGALVEPAEIALKSAVDSSAGHANASHTSTLSNIAKLKPSVDHFFDKVLVMAEDPALRAARLGLLASIEGMLVDVADFTKLQTDA